MTYPPATKAPPAYRWHYDDTGYYAYVLIDGDARVRDALCRRLLSRGIRCLLSGRSRRPASDGRTYDFYVRVTGPPPHDHPPPAAILEAFEGLPQFDPATTTGSEERISGTPETAVPTPELDRLRQEVSRLRDALTEAEAARERAVALATERTEDARRRVRAEYESSRRRLERAAAERDEERRRHRLELDGLRRRLEAPETPEAPQAPEHPSPAPDEGLRVRLEALEADLSARDAEIVELTQVWAAAEQAADASGTTILGLQNRIEQLEARDLRTDAYTDALNGDHRADARSAPPKAVTPRSSSRDVEELYSHLLARLAPGLTLVRGSVAVLANELANDARALEHLRRLDAEPAAVRSKPVRTAPGWREISFECPPDGNVGRIYYHRTKNAPCRVLVGHKKEQRRDFAWLRRNTA